MDRTQNQGKKPKLFNSEVRAGQPVQVGENTITPFAQIVSLHIPFPRGGWGFSWSRPVSVLNQSSSGDEQVLPIVDITRLVEWSLLGGSILSILLLRILKRKSKNKGD